MFCANPKIVFNDYETYVKFRDKVDLAIMKLGFKSHSEFLRALYYVLETMVSDDELELKQKSILNLLDIVRRKFARVKQ